MTRTSRGLIASAVLFGLIAWLRSEPTPPTTRVLQVQALALELRRAGILDPVTGFALVLTEEAERMLFSAQKEVLLATGHEPEALLAKGSSVVVHGCWQPEGDLVRLTAVTVDGLHRSQPGLPGC